MKTITPELLEKMNAGFEKRPDLKVLSRAISSTKLTDAAFVPENAAKLPMDFNIVVPTTGITAQKQSGRCWMFASMNMCRERVIKKCNMKDFALSGTYLTFYDKLEKANQFFEAVEHYADLPLDSRENAYIFGHGCCDGGQWDMYVGLVQKYGVVPAWIMPETVHSTGTAEWLDVMKEQLCEYGLELRELIAEGKDTTARREEMLAQYYNALCILYGQPTKVFDFEYTDKDGVFHADRGITPKEFFEKYVGDDMDDYIGFIMSPIHEYGRTYCQPFMGDLIEKEMKWLNLPIEQVEEYAIEMLKGGEGVMFSCDCHPYRNRGLGYWDQDTMDYRSILGGIPLGMNKAQRLQTGASTMNHCMFFCGVNLDEEGRPNRWKIENSWGDVSGQKGYFICSEKWFTEYTLQMFIHKKYVPEEVLAQFAKEPIPMKFWDPLA